MFEKAIKDGGFQDYREHMKKRLSDASVMAIMVRSVFAARDRALEFDRTEEMAAGKDRYLVVWTIDGDDRTTGDLVDSKSMGSYAQVIIGDDIGGAVDSICKHANKEFPNQRLVVASLVSVQAHVAIDTATMTTAENQMVQAMAMAYRLMIEHMGTDEQKAQVENASTFQLIRMALEDFGPAAMPEELVDKFIRKGILCQSMTVDARAGAVSVNPMKAAQLEREGHGMTSPEFLDGACSFWMDGGEEGQDCELGCDALIPHMLTLSMKLGGEA